MLMLGSITRHADAGSQGPSFGGALRKASCLLTDLPIITRLHTVCALRDGLLSNGRHRCALNNCLADVSFKAAAMAIEQRRPPEYILEVFADPASVKDIVKGESRPRTCGRC